MPSSFVLLQHNTTENQYHWDFLFEEPEGCMTFSVAQESAEEARKTGVLGCTAKRLADHRRKYLDYEGPVSGNRGTVQRIDDGTCETIDETIHFQGNICAGTINLQNYELRIMNYE